jgi:hypothetical protein
MEEAGLWRLGRVGVVVLRRLRMMRSFMGSRLLFILRVSILRMIGCLGLGDGVSEG